MDLSQVNNVALVQQTPDQKLKDLPRNPPLPMISAQVTEGKYGKFILLELEQVVVFRPNRMTSVLQAKESNFLNNKSQLVLKDVVKVGAYEICQFEIFQQK